MKVIARTGHGYLLEASATELAQLQGYTSEYSNGYQKGSDRIGDEIDITKMGQTAAYVKTMDQQVINDLIRRLQAAMDQVNQASENVEKLNLFDKLKD